MCGNMDIDTPRQVSPNLRKWIADDNSSCTQTIQSMRINRKRVKYFKSYSIFVAYFISQMLVFDENMNSIKKKFMKDLNFTI